MATTRSCDICGSTSDVQRYSMQHKQRVAASGNTNHVVDSKSSLSMGGIDLCFSDWARIAQPRQKQYIAGITTCDICLEDRDDTLRLTLKQSQRIEGKVRDKGRGSIVLCLDDWRMTGLPTMRSKPDTQTDPERVFTLNAERYRKE